MGWNINASYWRLNAQGITPATAGKVFYVSDSTWWNAQYLNDVFTLDFDWVHRVFTTITLALGACVAGRGDVVVIASDYTTAPTDTELWSAGTKWVKILFSNGNTFGEQLAMTANKALPATTNGTLFTVTWVCELISIIGIVTTVIQTQACNLKLSTVSNSATTDVCDVLNISAKAVQSRFSITGTFGDSLISTAKGVPVARQATSLVVQEGTIVANTTATNTGAVRWLVRYKPLQDGSRIVWA